MKRFPSFIGSIVFFVGLTLVYVGERLFGAGQGRLTLTALGIVVALGAVGLRVLRLSAVGEDRKGIEKAILGLYGLGLLALGLYFLQAEVVTKSSPKLGDVLAALWPALMSTSLLPLLLVEISYASMAHAPKVEGGRVFAALRSGVGLSSALIFALAMGYVTSERDVKWDLSYFRTARPSEASRKIVRALDAPLNVTLFFPAANEVGEQVFEYVSDLAKESPQVVVTRLDRDVEPAKSRELGVSSNGSVLVHREGKKEQLVLSTELEQSRSQLRNLDQEFQKRVLQVARSRRTVYMTTGHGERAKEKATAEDQRGTNAVLRDLLSFQNYEIRDLGPTEGLAADVPKDASMVFVVGPTQPFLPEESASLVRYVERGGRLFLALDPESGLDFKDVLSPFGLKFVPTILANEEAFVRRTQQVSDRQIIFSTSYSSHPSVTTLGQFGKRAPLFMVGAGYFEQLPDAAKAGSEFDPIVRAHTATFNDLNGNFTLDAPAETKRDWTLAAAVSKAKAGGGAESEGRLVALGDSDALSDLVLRSEPNQIFVVDGVKWLLGEESLAGAASSEVDVPLLHTRKENQAWFYLSVFFVPALILGIGFLVTRRRGKKTPAAQPVRAQEATS